MKGYMPILAAWLLACGMAHADSAVIDAAKSGDVAELQALLKKRPDVNATEIDGSTALLWATYQGNADAVKALLAAKADPDLANRYGMTPLLQAARIGNTAIVDALLKAGAKPEAAIRRGETPLMAAAATGRSDLVERFIAHGVDVNAKEPEEQQTALMWAAAEGHLPVVSALLAAGADPNTAARVNPLKDDLLREGGRQMVDWSRGGFTPLMFAAREGHYDVAKALLGAGARQDFRNPDNLTAMLLAVVNDWTDLAAMLLERGADPNDGSLHEVVQLHNLRFGATASDASRPRPDHHNEISPVELLGLLLDKGADPNKVTPYTLHAFGFGVPRPVTQSAYSRALQAQDVAILRLMIDKGKVDPNKVAANAPTPLMEVSAPARRGGLFSGFGDGGFRHPSERGSVQAAELLVSLGADVNSKTSSGETPLHRAAQNGDVAMIKFLAARGAALGPKSSLGLTPLDYAMGKTPPAPPAGAAAFGLPGGGPKPEAVALLRELMGLPAEKTPAAVASAGN